MSAEAAQPVAAMSQDAIARHSRSFNLASRLLDPKTATAVATLYAWCRHADDAIDDSPPAEQPARLRELRTSLALAYGSSLPRAEQWQRFQRLVAEYRVPIAYPQALLDGMEMDVARQRYRTTDELDGYCYRVAGVVGVMLCHVFGVRRASALRSAAHLGMAMQLTNICRDVMEDWQRGRLYIPDDLLTACGAGDLREKLDEPLPPSARAALALAMQRLLARADVWYASADSALTALPFRAQLATRAARLIYARIGHELARRQHDVFAGRAVVPGLTKLFLVVKAVFASLVALPATLGFQAAELPPSIRYPEDVLP